MSREIFWLGLTTVYTALLVFPYALNRIGRIGLAQVFLNPLPGDDPFDDAWAHRAYRSHMNAFENLTLFAPIAIGVHVAGASNEITQIASATFFWARFAHAPLYIFNVPVVRTIAYFIGLGATLTMAYQLLV
jgi:uncharacterized MAPEG superfamily protein